MDAGWGGSEQNPTFVCVGTRRSSKNSFFPSHAIIKDGASNSRDEDEGEKEEGASGSSREVAFARHGRCPLAP